MYHCLLGGLNISVNIHHRSLRISRYQMVPASDPRRILEFYFSRLSRAQTLYDVLDQEHQNFLDPSTNAM